MNVSISYGIIMSTRMVGLLAELVVDLWSGGGHKREDAVYVSWSDVKKGKATLI